MRFIIGYVIGVVLVYSVFFGLKMISLYENDIKRFFYKRFFHHKAESEDKE